MSPKPARITVLRVDLVGRADTRLEFAELAGYGYAIAGAGELQAAIQRQADNGSLQRVYAGRAEVRHHACCNRSVKGDS